MVVTNIMMIMIYCYHAVGISAILGVMAGIPGKTVVLKSGHQDENENGQKSGNDFNFFCHVLSCTAKTSKHGVKNYIWQFKHTLGLSFCQQNIFDKLNIFLRYHQMKVQK